MEERTEEVTMKLYNSKHKKIEEFVPIVPGQVSMYVCGPTVYNHPHIGNARPIVVFDLLRRVLVELGYKVHMVSNFTDIDDRIIEKAQNEKISEKDVASRYIDAYNEVSKKLNANGVDARPLATNSIASIIKFIEDLCEKGFAYEKEGNVFFRVDRVASYGEISSQNIEALEVGARIEANTMKENPLDFLLWKVTDDDGIKWDSPWGKGRPGWHTECVVMIQDEFKTNHIDIHGGGEDLKFPHHENESAQCKALHNHDLANYWIHNGMMNVDGIKMSKSLGNVTWAKDYISEFGTNVTRWLLLSTHYRLNLNFTEEVVEQSQNELNRIEQVLHKTEIEFQKGGFKSESLEMVGMVYEQFMAALQDDLNVANAQAVMFELVKTMNQSLRQRDKDFEVMKTQYNTLKRMLNVLGIDFETVVLSNDDLQLFNDWDAAKSAKDFETADGLRAKLLEKGLI